MRSLCMPFRRRAKPFLLTEVPMSSIYLEDLLDPIRLLAYTGMGLVGSTSLPVLFFFSGAACGTGWLCIMYVGAGAAGLEGLLGTIAFCRFCLPTVMWSASSSGGSDVTPGRAAYRDTLSHFINGLSGASHFSACTLAASRE